MSLTILDIVMKNLFGEKKIGLIVLNGSSGTTLKKFNLDNKYQEKLKRKSLLIENNDYGLFKFSDYISAIRKGLSKDIGRNVLIRERRLNPKMKNLLLRQYSM